MTAPDCPFPASCPVPDPDVTVLRRVRTQTVPSGITFARGHKISYPAEELVPGTGSTRFAPVGDAHHAYVARRQTTALLETAFHDVNPPEPRVHQHRLDRWSLGEVRLATDLRLIDLRDPELERLGIDRSQLVTSLPAHYVCTRAWASALHGRVVGGQQTHGLLWNSRQAELHAAADPDSLTADLLETGEVTEVAVLYAPPAPRRMLRNTGAGPGSLATGQGGRIAQELANLIGAAIYPSGV